MGPRCTPRTYFSKSRRNLCPCEPASPLAHAPLFHHQPQTGLAAFLPNRCSASPCDSPALRFGHHGAASTLLLRGSDSLNHGDLHAPAATQRRAQQSTHVRAARRRRRPKSAPLTPLGQTPLQLCGCVTPLPESVIAAPPASQK